MLRMKKETTQGAVGEGRLQPRGISCVIPIDPHPALFLSEFQRTEYPAKRSVLHS